MPRWRIHPDDVKRLQRKWAPSVERMEQLATYTKQQIMDRYDTNGQSGGEAWPPRRIPEWGYDNGKGILEGNHHMRDAWFSYGAVDGPNSGYAITANPKFYCEVQDRGTVGKGGEYPTIKPKKAKALFIPITEHAQRNSEAEEDAPATITSGGFGKPNRLAEGLSRFLGLPDLIKGRLKDGKLERFDYTTETYVSGVPDFIFLTKVDIPPRHQLPVSERELDSSVGFFLDLTFGGADIVEPQTSWSGIIGKWSSK